MMDSRVDISVVLNAHHEGRLMQASLHSALDAIAHSESHNLKAELIVVVDNPDESTSAFCAEFLPDDATLVNTSVGDLGQARNAGVEAASGTYVAFLDADDLWVHNWLTSAHRFIEDDASSREFILHPELVLYFEGRSCLWKLIDQDDPNFSTGLLLEHNLWPALSFARRSTYKAVPFSPSNLESGIGYEDWKFNCDAIASGIVHKAVPGTMHCLREKTWKRSLLKASVASNCLIGPTPLFAMPW